MTIERVNSGFLVAPDFKVTEFDHRVSEVVGAYAGWLADRKLFLGGGGYWLANRSRDREMAYGGLVVGWFAGVDRRLGFGAKGLVGGGRASLFSSLGNLFDDDDGPGGRISQGSVIISGPASTTLFPSVRNVSVRVREDFFVAEPEATVTLGLSRHLRVTAGAGYRLIAGARATRERLQGATGSVALQIGGG
jgi:hypothetical protein